MRRNGKSVPLDMPSQKGRRQRKYLALGRVSLAVDLGSATKAPILAQVVQDPSLESPPTYKKVPLAVDVDGTLIKTDLLSESLLALLKGNICFLFLLPFWALRGRAYFKREIARRITLDVAALPYNEQFLEFLRQQHGQGRLLILTTASDQILARAVADYLGIFSDVLASDGKQNLKGTAKCKALQDKFGQRGFDYAGNEKVDLKVWDKSNSALVVNAPDTVIRKAQIIGRVTRVFTRQVNSLSALIRTLRIKHGIKNTLVFVPLLAAQELEKFDLVAQAICAFAAFTLVASSVYVLNDLLDLTNDRRHHDKKNRPFASGELPLAAGLWMMPLLIVPAIVIGLFLPHSFLIVLGAYFLLNIGYSLYLKSVLLLDVILLAVFYSLRVVAGGVATGLVASNWLLVFSVFIFLSLAFAKRVSELQFLRGSHKEKCQGRGYVSADLEQLANFGVASGYISVLVFALYLNSPSAQQVYTSSNLLWTICPLLLYWISRLWLMVHRQQIPEDPVVFVFRDKVSWLVGAAIAAVLLLAA
jgi:4-hydroxybenzoate polyprenyltransferase/phosphoserine phosphatase